MVSASSFIRGIAGMLPMVLVLAFMYTVCMSIKTLVLEKELRLKEVLRAAGISNGALWAARFIENYALLVLPCVLISILVKVSPEGPPEAGTQSVHGSTWLLSALNAIARWRSESAVSHTQPLIKAK